MQKIISNFPKTAVLGIDGLSLSLARSLGQKGVFKYIGQLADSSLAWATASELPEVSPVNWASFFTAQGPEKHGIYGFTCVDPATYRLHITDYRHVLVPAVWDHLGTKGLVSKVINLPCTYPAPVLKGMLISGFVAPDLENAVYPRVLVPMLTRIGYRLEADTVKGLSQPELLLEDLKQTIRSRVRAFDLLWPDQAWDFFVIVFTELDRMSHFLQEAIEDESHRLHQACLDVLADLDRAAGHVLERYHELKAPKRLIALADHGFTRLECEVDLNTFLRSGGWLKMHRQPAGELDLEAMDPASVAFALDPGRIYIHSREGYARGRISPTEQASVRQDIMSALAELSYQGRKVLRHVYPGEELYPSASGPVPDLVCVPEKGFDLKAKLDRNQIFGHFNRTGTHCPGDVFFYDSQGSRPERIRDVLSGIMRDDTEGRG